MVNPSKTVDDYIASGDDNSNIMKPYNIAFLHSRIAGIILLPEIL